MITPSQKLIIITAPSGAGKTSVTRHLLSNIPQLEFSVSCATRFPRNHERDGVDYYFISVETFQEKIQNEEFVEWEMVYDGKYYGTLKSELSRIWEKDKYPLLDVDVQGGIHMQQQFPTSSFSLFIEPPSIEELERRLKARGTESADSLFARLNKAAYEMTFKLQFDRVILNDDLQRACTEAQKLVSDFLGLSSQYD